MLYDFKYMTFWKMVIRSVVMRGLERKEEWNKETIWNFSKQPSIWHCKVRCIWPYAFIKNRTLQHSKPSVSNKKKIILGDPGSQGRLQNMPKPLISILKVGNHLAEMGEVKGADLSNLKMSRISKTVMYGCESWTVKKAERRRTDAFELCCWRRLLSVPWTARRSNQSILKEISPGISPMVWVNHPDAALHVFLNSTIKYMNGGWWLSRILTAWIRVHKKAREGG